MPGTRKHAATERERTDRSLDDERRKTDDELAKRRATVEEDADTVVADARRRADEVLKTARAGADAKLDRDGAGTGERERVHDERRREDEVLKQERASADQQLLEERETRGHALATLLALERSQTDEDLLVERGRLDQMIGSRDDFLAIVSHDLRNNLSGLVMGVAALLRIGADSIVQDAIDREAHRIERYTARMTRLVGDLLDVVSIDAGQLAVTPAHSDAGELLRETLEVFRPLADVKKISLTSDVRAGSLNARFDHDRIFQVLANLVGNAIKFTAEGGRIDLAVEAVGHDLRFSIKDDGVGIERDKLGTIFERFWQVPEKHRAGLGLGLYISRCIVEAHGGKIWAESHPGAGSTFFFTLPAQ